MKIGRTKNAARNMVWGLVNKIAGLLLPFVCRAAIIRVFGMNYLGLNSLFTSILTVLNLAELGFGSAAVFFMYRAVAQDDVDTINALMHFYKIVYRVVGLIVLVLGLALLPFLQYLIKKDIPADLNLHIVYLITLAGTVVTYFLYAYKNCILEAYQRKDVIFNVSTIVAIVERILQLIFIFVTRNYYLYLSVAVLTNVTNNIIVAIIVKKKYPQFTAKGNLKADKKKNIAQKIKGLFLYSIGHVIIGPADNIVISAFLGLTIAGMYGNYYFVVTMVCAFIDIYYNAIRAGIGNSIAVETVDKNYEDFKLLQFLQNWAIGWCSVCMLCLFQDFIYIYAGKDAIFSFGVVTCFVGYFFAMKSQDVVYLYKDAGGMWEHDKWRPLTGGLVNLCLNIVLTPFIGVYGVLVASIFVLTVVYLPWSPKALFKEYFKRSLKEYYIMLLKGLATTLLMVLPTLLACHYFSFENVFVSLIVKATLCVVLPNTIFIVINIRSPYLKRAFTKIKAIIGDKKCNS